MQTNNKPKLSIITPSYNQGIFLERTIKSVLNQKYSNLEFIVIDGGSTDNSVEILKKYDDQITYWVSEKDKGQSHAFNKGLEKATGDIIGWINSDDIYYDDVFIRAIEYLEQNKEVDVLFGNYNFIDEHDNIIRTRKEIKYDYKIYLWSRYCYHANCAGFFRKKCFEDYGYLREDLQFGMDYELYLRFGKNNCLFAQDVGVYAGYRFHNESKSIGSNQKQIDDANKIFFEFANQYNNNKLTRGMLTVYYKGLRKFLKFIHGCYL